MTAPATTCVCTCSKKKATFNHEAGCELWTDAMFTYQEAFWNGERLVDVELGGGMPLGEKEEEEEEDDEEEMDEDLISLVLADLGLPPNDDEIWMEAAEKVGWELVGLLESLSRTDLPLTKAEAELIDEFAAALHARPVPGKEWYNCYCLEGNDLVYCGECGVMRETASSRWFPTFRRRRVEVARFLSSTPYSCEHASDSEWYCGICGVQRWSKSEPWTFWAPTQTGTQMRDEPVIAGTTVIKSDTKGTKSSYDNDWMTGGWTKDRHYGEVVTLPDGTKILASSQHDRKAGEEHPDFGCYMASSWRPQWISFQLNWTDHGLPQIPDDQVLWTVDYLLQLAREGRTVEIGCIGGHGRTGTLMAIMLLKAGITDGNEAMKWVWKNYCTHAIESKKQEWFILKMAAVIHGGEIPEMPQDPCTRWEHEKMWKAEEVCVRGVHCGRDWAADVEDFKKAPPTKTYVAANWSTQNHGSLGAPVTKDTPVPALISGTYGCTKRRHEILWWRKESCECKFAKEDFAEFATKGTKQVEDVSSLI